MNGSGGGRARMRGTDAYDPDKPWRGASDAQGHSAYFRLPVPKNWSGRIEAIVQNPRFKYQTAQEFIRDAVWHRFHWAGQKLKDPAFHQGLGLSAMELLLGEYQEELEEAARFKEMVGATVHMAREAGDWDEFQKKIDSLETMAREGLREPMLSDVLEDLSRYRRSMVRA